MAKNKKSRDIGETVWTTPYLFTCEMLVQIIFTRLESLQSIYVTRDRVILKFEARVQIYVAVLNICCEIQKSGRNVVRFSKINSYEISFCLVLFKNMRNIRFLGVWWHYFAVNSRISETFSEKSLIFRWNVENYKEESECSFQFRNLRSRVT